MSIALKSTKKNDITSHVFDTKLKGYESITCIMLLRNSIHASNYPINPETKLHRRDLQSKLNANRAFCFSIMHTLLL